MSSKTHGLKRGSVFLCLVGPTGGGKTTLRRMLMNEFGESVRPSISSTSRTPREGEVHGKNYYFFSREEFEAKIKSNEFFEWEETHGNLYGTLRKTLADAQSDGVDVLFDIDIRGALRFKREFKEQVVIVFLVPPSPLVLKERLQARGAESGAQMQTRLETAQREYEQFLQDYSGARLVDYLVVNEDLDEAYRSVSSILLAERVRAGRLSSSEVQKTCAL